MSDKAKGWFFIWGSCDLMDPTKVSHNSWTNLMWFDGPNEVWKSWSIKSHEFFVHSCFSGPKNLVWFNGPWKSSRVHQTTWGFGSTGYYFFTRHCGFLEHWNSQKSLCNIWQRFSCLLDESIEKKWKKKIFHGGLFFKSTLSVLRCTWTGRIIWKKFWDIILTI